MPVLKDRVENLEYMIEKLQEELRKLRSCQENQNQKEEKPTISPTNMRRRAVI